MPSGWRTSERLTAAVVAFDALWCCLLTVILTIWFAVLADVTHDTAAGVD